MDADGSLGGNRQAIVNHQDKVHTCKRRVSELRKMLHRNKDQKVYHSISYLYSYDSESRCQCTACQVFELPWMGAPNTSEAFPPSEVRMISVPSRRSKRATSTDAVICADHHDVFTSVWRVQELCESLKVVLKEAEASLQAAQVMSDKLTAEMNKQDELRKWTKF